MAKNNHIILGVHIQDRVKQVPEIQKLFTDYGTNIKTRLGLHEVQEGTSSAAGLILLEMVGDSSCAAELARKLNAHDGVEVQKMDFAHD